MPSRMRPGKPDAAAAGIVRGSWDQAALLAADALLAYTGAGRPMIRASPQTVQAHSWQSPSGTSGQLAGSA